MGLAAVLPLLSACGGDPSERRSGSEKDGTADAADAALENRAAARAKPPIVVISIDTLRADRLPAWGYDAVETPAIDALVADGVRFSRAYTHAPMTLPAHASLMSGLWPNAHGVRDNMGYTLDSDRLPHLPSQLASAGYATGGMVSSFVLRRETGMARGFDAYDDRMPLGAGSGQSGLQRPGGETVDLALQWLDSLAGNEKPAFLFVHLFEPHTPYDPPEPFRSRYSSAYDGEVATADAAVGRLLDGLEQRGLYHDATIVLLSDHGESLGEHGEGEHGIFLYPATLHIPLVLKLPDSEKAGTVVHAPVQLADVAPTLLELAGLERGRGEGPGGEAGPALDGASLLPRLEAGSGNGRDAERILYAETYYPRLYFGWSELRSIVEGPHQLISSPEPELYDLVADPRASRNLLLDERRLFARLRQSLAEVPARFEGPAEVDADTRARLASLGYVGGARSADRGELPSPASQIHLLERLGEAFRAAAGGDPARAAEIYSSVVAENPRMLFAWEQLARARQKLGQLDEASQAYARAVEISGGSPHLALSAAELELRRGELVTARALAEGATGYSPAGAAGLLARIAVADRRTGDAESHARELLSHEPDSVAAVVVLAQVDALRGRPEAALGRLDSAASAAGRDPTPNFHQQRGDLLARLGRPDEAADAFEEEIRLFPSNPRGYAGLALLQATDGRPELARATLGTMLDAIPEAGTHAMAIRFFHTLGDDAAARDLAERARRRFPEDPRFRAPGP